jgi:hypothetical protein
MEADGGEHQAGRFQPGGRSEASLNNSAVWGCVCGRQGVEIRAMSSTPWIRAIGPSQYEESSHLATKSPMSAADSATRDVNAAVFKGLRTCSEKLCIALKRVSCLLPTRHVCGRQRLCSQGQRLLRQVQAEQRGAQIVAPAKRTSPPRLPQRRARSCASTQLSNPFPDNELDRERNILRATLYGPGWCRSPGDGRTGKSAVRTRGLRQEIKKRMFCL